MSADYIVEGSVRTAGGRVRVGVQLLDALTGRHIWAEHYDRDLRDIFAIQDDITGAIVGQIEPELGALARQRAVRKPTEDLDAWDRYHLGLARMYDFSAAANREAQELFLSAIESDAGFAQAHARLAYCMILEMVYFDAEASADLLDRALAIAKRGVSLDDHDAFCYSALGRVHIARREYELGLAACQNALRLNPHMGVAYCSMGDAYAYAGRPDDALPCFEEALRLSPNDPWRWAFYSYGALAYLLLENYDHAVKWAHDALISPHCRYWANAHLLAALGHLQRHNEIVAAREELLLLKPEFCLAYVDARLFYLEKPQRQHYLEGLRLAGVETGVHRSSRTRAQTI
jgi:adenylate cyclase